MKKLLLKLALIFIAAIISSGGEMAYAAGPVILFSDLINGPKSGWEGSSTKGAAVTIYGKNFGSASGTSHVTCGGQALSNSADYAEWGILGTSNGVPRGLERITFFLNSRMPEGATTINVTVNGVTSNSIPFYVRSSGKIYFVALENEGGSDSNNGTKATDQGGENGPWASPMKGLHSNNQEIRPGDIIYIRGGSYTASNVQLDNDDLYLNPRDNDAGTVNNHIAFAAYPGEMPTFNCSGRDFFSAEKSSAEFSLGHAVDYLVFSKLTFTSGQEDLELWGIGNRVIGCTFKNNDKYTQAGVVMVLKSRDTHIYGNYFYNNGYDYYKHDIYIKTEGLTRGTMNRAEYCYVGWNEFDSFNNNRGSNCRGGDVEIQTESGQSYHTRYIYVHDNYFHDGNTEWLYLLDCNPVYAYNNIVGPLLTKSDQNSGLELTGAVTLYLYNNSFYHAGISSTSSVDGFNGNNHIYSKNNIWYTYPGQTFLSGDVKFVSENDAFFPNASYSGSSGPIELSLDPYRDISKGDFVLNTLSGGGSSCIDAGTATVNEIVTQDYNGASRPQGSGFDIGALEASGSEPPLQGPEIQVSALSHDFGSIISGGYSDWTLTISNIGTKVLSIDSVTSDNQNFTVISPSFPQSLDAGTTVDVVIRFQPSVIGTITGNLTVKNNDADESNLSISLSGIGSSGSVSPTPPSGLRIVNQ